MSDKTPNLNTETARRYDAETRHTYEKIRSEPHYLDWENQPLVYKIYQGLSQIHLEPEWSGLDRNTLDALNNLEPEVSQDAPREIDRSTLSRILFHAYGQTARKSYPGAVYYLRAAPSAGALYPAELYFVSRSLEGIAPGIYHFDTGQGRLTCLREGDFSETLAAYCSIPEVVRESPITFLLSAIPWRSSWKYRSRAYRYCALDSGHLAGNLLPIGSVSGFKPVLLCNFLDGPVNKLLGLDEKHEQVYAVVSLSTDSADNPSWEETVPPISKIKPRYQRLSKSEVEYPLIQEIHRATRLTDPDDLPRPSPASNRNPLRTEQTKSTNQKQPSDDLGPTILSRRSGRSFTRDPIPNESLLSILEASCAPYASDLFHSLNITPHVVVNAVAETEPGVYLYDPKSHSLQLKRKGVFREEIRHACLEQKLLADSAATVFLFIDLDAVLEMYGNRGYRIAHIQSGIIGEFIYLAARSLGVCCTGIGAFYDDEVLRFFGYDPTKWQILYVLTCGMETVDSRLIP